MYTKIYQDCHLIQLENIRILDICILSHHIIRYSTTLLWSCSIPLPPPLPAKVSSNRPSSCARLRRNGFDAQGRRGCCWKSQQNLRFECKHSQTTCKNMISLGHDLYPGRFSWIFHVLLIVVDFVVRHRYTLKHLEATWLLTLASLRTRESSMNHLPFALRISARCSIEALAAFFTSSKKM